MLVWGRGGVDRRRRRGTRSWWRGCRTRRGPSCARSRPCRSRATCAWRPSRGWSAPSTCASVYATPPPCYAVVPFWDSTSGLAPAHGGQRSPHSSCDSVYGAPCHANLLGSENIPPDILAPRLNSSNLGEHPRLAGCSQTVLCSGGVPVVAGSTACSRCAFVWWHVACVQEAEAKAAAAEERERAGNERLTQTQSRLAVMEAQVRRSAPLPQLKTPSLHFGRLVLLSALPQLAHSHRGSVST